MPVKKSKKKSVKKPVKKVKRAVKPVKKVLKKVVKKLVKKQAVKPTLKPVKQTTIKLPASLQPVGVVTHFFDKISVAIIKLNKNLKLGSRIRIEGHGSSFEQTITSMQEDYKPLQEAKAGEEVGIKVNQSVKEGDAVYLV